jgi:hypoxanthine phosphoribosyltransferase
LSCLFLLHFRHELKFNMTLRFDTSYPFCYRKKLKLSGKSGVMEFSEELELRLLFPADRISAEVQRLAEAISHDYEGQDLLLVVVLKGAFVFAADLVRCIRIPFTLDFIRLSSYSGTETTGEVNLISDLLLPVEGKHILVVEDIVDTGASLSFLLEQLKSRGPKSLKVCALIDKLERRQTAAVADYTGMVCSSGFLVGYGLDLDERCRQLPAIYEVVANPSRGGLNDSTM